MSLACPTLGRPQSINDKHFYLPIPLIQIYPPLSPIHLPSVLHYFSDKIWIIALPFFKASFQTPSNNFILLFHFLSTSFSRSILLDNISSFLGFPFLSFASDLAVPVMSFPSSSPSQVIFFMQITPAVSPITNLCPLLEKEMRIFFRL